jgi:hypothetical protein
VALNLLEEASDRALVALDLNHVRHATTLTNRTQPRRNVDGVG